MKTLLLLLLACASAPPALALNCRTAGPEISAPTWQIPASMGHLPPAHFLVHPADCGNNGNPRHAGYAIQPTVSTTAPIILQPTPQAPDPGTSDATIQANFPAVYLFNVQQNDAYEAQFAQLDDYMLANLSNEYVRNGGDVPALMAAMAAKLTAADLLRVQGAFGLVVTPAVASGAPPEVQIAYLSAPAATLVARSHAQYVAMGIGAYFPPEFSMTQYDLFLEYFAVKGATVASALVRTAAFEAQVLYTTYQVAYWSGGKLVALLDYVDPAINIEIGNIIGTTVDYTVDLISSPGGTGYVDDPSFYLDPTEYGTFVGDWGFDFSWDWNVWF